MNNYDQYDVQLDNFNGPLDLLLHLIKEKEMDIFDISLSTITDQLLEYIHNAQRLNLEITADYLLVASYLIEIKTNLLIPKEEIEIDSAYEESARQELIQRLLEYKKFKEISLYLKEEHKKEIQHIAKPRTYINVPKVNNDKLPLPENLDVEKLSKTFAKLLERINSKKPLSSNIIIREVSPDEMAIKIINNLNNTTQKISLEELMVNFDQNIETFVACFIAILDLARKQEIVIFQDDYLAQIYIQRCNNTNDVAKGD